MGKELRSLLTKTSYFDLTSLTSLSVSPTTVRKLLHDSHYDLVVYFGHGKADGWWFNVLQHFGGDEDLNVFKGAIVYTMACFSATTFGERCVHAGARAYIGNTAEVWLFRNDWDRPYATEFRRIWQNGVVNLLRGFPVNEVVTRTKADWTHFGHYLEAHPSWLDSQASELAFANATYHTYCGQGHAHLPCCIDTPDDLSLEALSW